MSHNRSDATQTFTVGCKYTPDKDTQLKAKVDTDGILSLAAIQKVGKVLIDHILAFILTVRYESSVSRLDAQVNSWMCWMPFFECYRTSSFNGFYNAKLETSMC